MNFRNSILYTLIILLLSIINLQAQNTTELLKASGFNYFCIEDTSTVSPYRDSIRFVISDQQAQATIFFIQGSSTDPLFVEIENKLYPYLTAVAPSDLYDDYNLVFISKPGVPVITDQNVTLTDNQKNIFDHANMKENYISTIKQVYDFLQKEKKITKSQNYLFGHSQGYGIVAKYATVFPEDFDKIICASSSIYNVPAIRVNQLFDSKAQEKKAQEIQKEKLDKIYNAYKGMYQMAQDTLNPYHLYYKKDISFWKDLTLDYLVKIEKPLLVIYGMNDPDVQDNHLLPIIFINKHKDNLSIFPYPGYDHNFNETIIGENNTEQSIPHWQDVFRDVVEWIEL